jgi:hypothetical protein
MREAMAFGATAGFDRCMELLQRGVGTLAESLENMRNSALEDFLPRGAELLVDGLYQLSVEILTKDTAAADGSFVSSMMKSACSTRSVPLVDGDWCLSFALLGRDYKFTEELLL